MSDEATTPPELHGRRLQISVAHGDGEIRIELSGELDIGSAADLEEALIAADRAIAKRIVLDLSDLQFLDSTGLRAILSAELRASVDGTELVLIPGPERVQRLFVLTGTAEYLRFADGDTPPDNISRLPD